MFKTNNMSEKLTELSEKEKLKVIEDYKAQKEEALKFYKEEIPFLEKQVNYEELLTRLEVAKMQRLEIRIAQAQMMHAEQEAAKQENSKVNKESKLKPVEDE